MCRPGQGSPTWPLSPTPTLAGSWAAVASTMATSMVLDAIEQAIWTRQQEGVLDLKDVAVGSRPHLCVDLGRVRLRGLCHRRLRSQDPGLRVASTMATSMVLDAIEQAIWTRQQEGVLDLKDVRQPGVAATVAPAAPVLQVAALGAPAATAGPAGVSRGWRQRWRRQHRYCRWRLWGHRRRRRDRRASHAAPAGTSSMNHLT